MAEGIKTSSFVKPTFQLPLLGNGRCDYDELQRLVVYSITTLNAGESFLDKDGTPARVPVRLQRPEPNAQEVAAKAVFAAARAAHMNPPINATQEQKNERFAEFERAFKTYEIIRKESQIEWDQVGHVAEKEHLLYQQLSAELEKILSSLKDELFLGRSGLGLGDNKLKLHELVTQIEAQSLAGDEIRPNELLLQTAEVVRMHTDPKMYKDFKDVTLTQAFLKLTALYKRAVKSRCTHVLTVEIIRAYLIDLIPGAEDGQHVCRDRCSAAPMQGEERKDLESWYASILPIVSKAQKECPDRPLKRAAPATVQSGIKPAAGQGLNFKALIGAMEKFQSGACSKPCDFCHSNTHAFGKACDKAQAMWPQVFANTVSKYDKFAEEMPKVEHPPAPTRTPRSASESPKDKP